MPTPKTRVPLILGTMTFGEKGSWSNRISDPLQVQNIINAFGQFGHTELDTARIYGSGTTEVLLSGLNTSAFSIDSKAFPVSPGAHSPAKLRETCETILSTLKRPKIRVFYLHAPDRSVPFEETLEECNKMHQEGKFEELGLSNFAAWEVAQMVGICEKNGWLKPTIYQVIYNAITRSAETELFPCCRALGLRVVVFNPIAGGFFAGKVSKPEDTVEPGGRFDPSTISGKIYRARYFRDGYFSALSHLQTVLSNLPPSHPDHGISLVAVGLRWVQHHSPLKPTDGVIIGVSSLKHLEENCTMSEGGPLSGEVLKALDEAWYMVKPNAPSYFH